MGIRTATAGRIAQLDSLRGVSALLVLLHHARQAYENSVDDAWTGIGAYLDLGRLGVVVFFMISGFVIVKAIPGKDASSAALFWKHRFFRLYPPFWVSVFLAALIAPAAVQSQCCAFTVPASGTALLSNLTMFPLRFHQPMLVGVYWTLELEMLFYGLVTAITMAGRNSYATVSRLAIGLFACAAAAAALTALRSGAKDIGHDQSFLVLLHLSFMFAGSAIRYHWERRPTREALFTTMPGSLKLYLGLVLGFFSAVVLAKARHSIEPHTFRVAATYILSVVMFLGCLRFFSGSWLGTFLGNRSYGIYLLHIPMLTILSYEFGSRNTPLVSFPLFVILAGVLTLLGADLLRRCVERPAIRFAHSRVGWRLRPQVILGAPDQVAFETSTRPETSAANTGGTALGQTAVDV